MTLGWILARSRETAVSTGTGLQTEATVPVGDPGEECAWHV